jgi:hypothetical protein
MDKKVIFNGIEILTSEDDVSAKSFFDFTEEVIVLLEKDLDKSDENFRLIINTEFFQNKKPKHSISVNGLSNQQTRGKVVKILQKASGVLSGHATGTASVNLVIEDI